MSNDVIEIDKVEDVCEGDTVTLSYAGHEYTGLAWNDCGYLRVGTSSVNGGISVFVRATRPKPPLPTETGSVIAEVINTYGEKIDLMVLDEDQEWIDPLSGNYYTNEYITSWKPAKIVVSE